MRVFQCAVLGQGGVGKSCITVRFINGSYLEWYDPTIEDSYRKQFAVDGHACLLEILDTAGVEQFMSLNDVFIRESEAFVLVFARPEKQATNPGFDIELGLLMISVNSKESYDEISRIRETIYRVKSPPEGISVPIVVVGNKCDLVEDREVDEEQTRLTIEKWGCTYFESSARFDTKITPIFEQIVRELRVVDTLRRPRKDPRGGGGGRKRKLKGCTIL